MKINGYFLLLLLVACILLVSCGIVVGDGGEKWVENAFSKSDKISTAFGEVQSKAFWLVGSSFDFGNVEMCLSDYEYSNETKAQFAVEDEFLLPSTITEDTVYKAGSLYIVGDDVTISAGVTVTFEEGCEIQFYDDREYYNSPQITVYGNLIFDGSVSNTVSIFPNERNDTFVCIIKVKNNGTVNMNYTNAVNLELYDDNYVNYNNRSFYNLNNSSIYNSCLESNPGYYGGCYYYSGGSEFWKDIDLWVGVLNNNYINISYGSVSAGIIESNYFVCDGLASYIYCRAKNDSYEGVGDFSGNIVYSDLNLKQYDSYPRYIIFSDCCEISNNQFISADDSDPMTLCKIDFGDTAKTILGNTFSEGYRNYAEEVINNYLDANGNPRFDIFGSYDDISETMTLGAAAIETGIELTWFQDCYDNFEGYNIYRADSEDGNYIKINSDILPAADSSFVDVNVEHGKTYWYTFTVVISDFSESGTSDKVYCVAADAIDPTVYHTPVTQGYKNEDIFVSCVVRDNMKVGAVDLYYRTIGSSEWKTIVMSNSKDEYSATILGIEVSLDGLEYYIVASDGTNFVFHGNSQAPYTITVYCNHEFTKQSTVHLKAGATCTSKAIYYKSCVYCDEQGGETFEYGDILPHVFTKKVTTDDYKASNATCTVRAKYNYCCETCTVSGGDTYEYGDTLPHTFTKEVTTDDYKVSDATCTARAKYNYCCEFCTAAGSTMFEYGEVLDHIGGTATCTTQAVCERCNDTYGQMLAHHEYEREKASDEYLKSEASCTNKAEYYKSCECGAKGTMTFEYGEKSAHVYNQKVIFDKYLKFEGSCTEKATYYYSCSCGAIGTDTFVDVAAEHIYSTIWSYDEINHWHQCENCESINDEVYHTYDDGVITKQPSHIAEGEKNYTCICGYIKIEKLKKNNNCDFGAWIPDENGISHIRECSCGEKEIAFHEFDNGVVTEEPTHTETGVKTYTCDSCRYTKIEILDKTPDHGFGYWVPDPNGMSHIRECSCGEKEEAAHTFGNGVVTQEPTHIEVGAKTYTCNDCGYLQTETIDKTTDHSFGAWTAGADAINHIRSCVCGEIEKDTHSFDDGNVTQYPTHIETGIMAYTCGDCGYTYDVAIEKTSTHNFGAWVANEDVIKHTRACVCGYKETEGHFFNDGVLTVEPTYEADGVMTYTCNGCGITKTETVEKTEKKSGCASSRSSGLALIAPLAFSYVGTFLKRRKIW